MPFIFQSKTEFLFLMPKQHHFVSFVLIMFLLFVGNIGCKKSNKPADLPPLYRCQLTFTQEGTPLENAGVILKSTDPSFKWAVGGITNAQGVVDVVTHGQFFGAPEGTYKVVVSKTEAIPDGTPKELPPDVDPASIMTPSSGMVSIFTFVEKEYTDAETTPLTIEIKKGKNAETYECGKSIRELLRRVRP